MISTVPRLGGFGILLDGTRDTRVQALEARKGSL